MKSGEIKIFDTKLGALIVPYYQKGNLVFLSSYTNGNLAFIDLQGKITVINVFKKVAVFENSEAVKTLLLTLNNKEVLHNDKKEEVDNECEDEDPKSPHYISSFYIVDSTIYVEVVNTSNVHRHTYCLNNALGTWEKVASVSTTIINDANSSNIAAVDRHQDMDVDQVIESPGIGITTEARDRELFRLEQDKQGLIDEIGLAMSKMEKQNHPKLEENNTLEELEERIMLYERLEHKEEYFASLETYLVNLVSAGDIDRIGQVISKFDSQYGVHKKLKFDSSGYDEFFLGIKKSKILEDFIKPKLKMRNEIYTRVFKNK